MVQEVSMCIILSAVLLIFSFLRLPFALFPAVTAAPCVCGCLSIAVYNYLLPPLSFLVSRELSRHAHTSNVRAAQITCQCCPSSREQVALRVSGGHNLMSTLQTGKSRSKDGAAALSVWSR